MSIMTTSSAPNDEKKSPQSSSSDLSPPALPGDGHSLPSQASKTVRRKRPSEDLRKEFKEEEACPSTSSASSTKE